MASITIRNIEEALKDRLRLQAAHHRRSMEEEAREILRSALASVRPEGENLAAAVRRRFARVGGVDLELPPREPIRQPPDFAT
jgi:plasmid stability protein